MGVQPTERTKKERGGRKACAEGEGDWREGGREGGMEGGRVNVSGSFMGVQPTERTRKEQGGRKACAKGGGN